MQNSDLLAQHPPDNKQRFNQHRQIREIFEELHDPGLEPGPSSYTNLETKVT